MRKMPVSLFILWFVLFGCKTEIKELPKDYAAYHTQASAFCEKNNYNTDYYILIDLSIHSGKNRFFVYDFNTTKNVHEKLVTHGSCDVFEANETKWETVKFSNKIDSHCSSKGKFKIGKRDASKWGINIKYWLHGLEIENSNAERRVTVLHSWEAVADKNIYPKYAPLSWGCPAVSNEFMAILDVKLQQSKEPVLLWIVD